MSSSKIQEYNLDPNMGLAKENTSQEILSAVANGVESSFRSPIRCEQFYSNPDAFTGTGKGILSANLTNGRTATIVIDGVTIVNGEMSYMNGVIFEFKESFSAKAAEEGFPLVGYAVFY